MNVASGEIWMRGLFRCLQARTLRDLGTNLRRKQRRHWFRACSAENMELEYGTYNRAKLIVCRTRQRLKPVSRQIKSLRRKPFPVPVRLFMHRCFVGLEIPVADSHVVATLAEFEFPWLSNLRGINDWISDNFSAPNRAYCINMVNTMAREIFKLLRQLFRWARHGYVNLLAQLQCGSSSSLKHD